MIVAVVTIGGTKALVGDDGRWQVRGDLVMEGYLNLRFGNALFPTSPAEGYPFENRVAAAAEQLGGDVRVNHNLPRDSSDRRVY